MQDLDAARKKIDRAYADFRAARRQAKKERTAVARAGRELQDLKAAQDVAQKVAAAVQQQAHARIAEVVSRCLGAVFDDPYEFKVEFERKRGKTEARLTFVRDGVEVDPVTAAGGGVVDVAAFALRLAALVLQFPAPRRLMVLDEPFRFVSKDRTPRLRSLLRALSHEMGVQFVIVTHDPGLEIGKVVDLG